MKTEQATLLSFGVFCTKSASSPMSNESNAATTLWGSLSTAPSSQVTLARGSVHAPADRTTWDVLRDLLHLKGVHTPFEAPPGFITPSSTSSSLLASRKESPSSVDTPDDFFRANDEHLHSHAQLVQAHTRGFLARQKSKVSSKHSGRGVALTAEPLTDPAIDLIRWGPTLRVHAYSSSQQRRIGVDVSAHVVAASSGPAAEGQRSVGLYTTRVSMLAGLNGCHTPSEAREHGDAHVGTEWEVVHRYSEWRRLHEMLMQHGRREFREQLGKAFPPRLSFLAACKPVQRARQHALDAYLARALDISHEVDRVPDELCAFLCNSHAQWRLTPPLGRPASQRAIAP